MTPDNATGGCLPSPEQQLLLKACALPPEGALTAWQQWRVHFNSGALDKASLRLLPALYRNLHRAGYDGPEMPALKESYQRNWFWSQKKFLAAVQVLKLLQKEQVPAMLLKGVALAHSCYPDPCTRPMADIDIAVPTSQAAQALEVLQIDGWLLRDPLGPPFPYVPYQRRLKKNFEITSHASHLAKDKGEDLDLHWHILTECCGLRDDEAFWQRAVRLRIGEQEALTLAPADQLLHTCIHGYMFNEIHSMRWVLDAYMIVTAAGGRMDWEALLRSAQERRLTLRLTKALEFLQEAWGKLIPDDILQRLRAMAVSRFERFEHGLLTRADIRGRNSSILWSLQWAWCRQQRLHPKRPLARRILAFPEFLASELYLGSARELPRVLFQLMWAKYFHRLPDGAALLVLFVWAGCCGLMRPAMAQDMPLAAWDKVPVMQALAQEGQKALPHAVPFAGMTWFIKGAPSYYGRGPNMIFGPGPNYFSSTPDNVWLDAQGYLHLAITRNRDGWQCAEIMAPKSMGYGEYRWVVSGHLPTLDPNVVLGLFTYENLSNEIDFELSRWGDIANKNAQFVVQPSGDDSKERFDTGNNMELTCSLLWLKGLVRGRCWAGGDTARAPLVDWTYTGHKVPEPGFERARANLWLLHGRAPVGAQKQEVVLRSFHFQPIYSW